MSNNPIIVNDLINYFFFLFIYTQFRVSCIVTLQIGRFYEFRILTINGNGTRGCSDSTIFQLNESKFQIINLKKKKKRKNLY